jgi:hypothetical protein
MRVNEWMKFTMSLIATPLSSLCFLFLLSPLFLSCGILGLRDEFFTEDLQLSILPEGKLLAHFDFNLHWNVDFLANNHSGIYHSHIHSFTSHSLLLWLLSTVHHTHLFPKSLANIVHRHKVEEFHLAFTQGRWRYDKWGIPTTSSTATPTISPHYRSAPAGVELIAWFLENDPGEYVSSFY